MSAEGFDYELERARIAAWPSGLKGRREDSSLLVASRGGSGACGLDIRDERFSSLPKLLSSGDLLVLNDSLVIPSRFFARHVKSGKEIEVLLFLDVASRGFTLSTGGSRTMKALARPLKRLRSGDELLLSERLSARVIERGAGRGEVFLEVRSSETCSTGEELLEIISKDALMPIPPYIRGGRAEASDRSLYQTVYASVPGSVAAPTAGLHFSRELLQELNGLGVETTFLTLHVGRPSFEFLEEGERSREMGAERYRIPANVREKIERTKRSGRRVVVVGTTAMRALEDFYSRFGETDADDSWREARIFIRPGHVFRIADALITNFHQPRSTHILLVCAFFGEEAMKSIYHHATLGAYRFLSYGDAMLLVRGEL